MAVEQSYGKMVTDGLVLYLNAADRNSYVSGSTSWIDLINNTVTASLINGSTYSSVNAGSIVFDGIDDRATLNTSFTIDSSSNWTIQTWVKSFQTSSNAAYMRLLGSSEGDRNFFFLEWNNRIFARNSTATSFAFQTGFTPSLSLNTSSFLLTIIGRNGNLELYRNETQTTVNTALTGSLIFSDIMNERRSSSPGGEMSSFCLYNRALSSQEILQNYNSQKSRFGLT
jgi:hypothetical protein